MTVSLAEATAAARRIADDDYPLNEYLGERAVRRNADARLLAGFVLAARVREPEQIARAFHEAYERLADEFDYETRRETAVPWDEVPEGNKRLMVAVASEVFAFVLAGDTERLRTALDSPCGCAETCGDDGDVDGPGVCKGLPRSHEPLVEIVVVRRDALAGGSP